MFKKGNSNCHGRHGRPFASLAVKIFEAGGHQPYLGKMVNSWSITVLKSPTKMKTVFRKTKCFLKRMIEYLHSST
jgi:hypothetical protein